MIDMHGAQLQPVPSAQCRHCGQQCGGVRATGIGQTETRARQRPRELPQPQRQPARIKGFGIRCRAGGRRGTALHGSLSE